MPKTYWAIMKERHGAAYEEAFDALADIIEHTARLNGFHRMVMQTLPVAHARNAYCQEFFYRTPDPDPNDTLIMLDADHHMPRHIVEKLASHNEGVVGAMATSRAETPFIPFWKRGEDGVLYSVTDWEDGEFVEGTIIGTGAIAIKRWVLEKLKHCAPSWFRYQYAGKAYEATEDMYFAYECEKLGIAHWCDTSLWIPHCTVAFTTPAEWREYIKDNPQVRNRPSEKPIQTGGDEWGKQIAATIARTL